MSFEREPVLGLGANGGASKDEQDAADLAGCRAGCEEAFASIYRRHGGKCLALARQVLRDDQMAEDAVQEAFLQFWKEVDTFDPRRCSAGSWLMMLTHRRAVDRVRSEQRRSRPVATTAEVDARIDVEQMYIDHMVAVAARDLLKLLPLRLREVVVLAYWGSCTMVEIAERTGTPVGTVKTRMRSALRGLRELTQSDEFQLAGYDVVGVSSQPAAR